MPLKCPACQSELRHDGPMPPAPGRVYCCSVCRLELSHDSATGKMKVAPMRDARPDRKPRKGPGT